MNEENQNPAYKNQFFDEAGQVDGRPVFVVPKDHSLESLDRFEKKIRGRFEADTIEALVEYSRIYNEGVRVAFVSNGNVYVSLDHHSSEEPGDCLHSASYKSKPDPTFVAIRENMGYTFSQRGFVNFWRDNVSAIVEPDAATVLEQLEQIKSFRSGSAEYGATNKSASSKVESSLRFEMMDEFYVGIRPFLDLDLSVKTLVRVTPDTENGLMLSYKLPRLEQSLEIANNEFLKLVTVWFEEEEIVIFNGRPISISS